MAFRFRLERVARYRQRIVDEHGRLVAAADRAVVGLKIRLAAVDEDIAGHLQDFSDPHGGGLSVQRMISRTMWITHLETVRAEYAAELLTAVTELQQRRERLNEVWRELEVLNKLREKQRADWQAAQVKRENRDLDEIGQIRADRARRSKVAV